MSSVNIALKTFRQLQPEDIKILQAIETQTKQYQHVPEEQIPPKAKLPPPKVQHHLTKLTKSQLLQQQTHPYIGYRLTTAGYDCLALNSYVKANVLEAIGKPLGVGKEADVHDALTPTKQQVAIKFHRLGRTSFKQTKRKRGYTQQYAYTPNWHQQSTTAAKKRVQSPKTPRPPQHSSPKTHKPKPPHPHHDPDQWRTPKPLPRNPTSTGSSKRNSRKRQKSLPKGRDNPRGPQPLQHPHPTKPPRPHHRLAPICFHNSPKRPTTPKTRPKQRNKILQTERNDRNNPKTSPQLHRRKLSALFTATNIQTNKQDVISTNQNGPVTSQGLILQEFGGSIQHDVHVSVAANHATLVLDTVL